jgi:hypothetical protein
LFANKVIYEKGASKTIGEKITNLLISPRMEGAKSAVRVG